MVTLEGRLDTVTAPELEKALGAELDLCDSLVFDSEKLSYISSAGLHVLLSSQKKMNGRKGTMVIRHVNELIVEIFETTGFMDVFTVE